MPPKRPGRATAPVRFVPDNAEDEVDGEDGVGENMMDVLSLVKEFKKKTAKKTTNRSAAFQAKKNTIITSARRQADEMVREGSAYIEQCKLDIDQLRSQELQPGPLLEEALSLWRAQEGSVMTLLSLYPPMIKELAPRRANDINSVNEMLENHPQIRDASRHKAMKAARRAIKVGLENQRLATDASILIKSYKQMLLS